jgi:tetratricopeptide (TPR) repeat protein
LADQRARASDLPGAIVAWEQALASSADPIEAASLALRVGEAWARLGAPDEAEPWWRRVADDPRAATPAQRREALVHLARAAEADPARARPHLTRLLGLLDDAPTHQADVRLELARLHIAQRQPAPALRHLDHVRAHLVPHLTPAHLVRVEHLTGAALHAARRTADALEHLHEAARHEQDRSRRAHVSIDLGDALAALGSHALAQRQYEAAQAWAVELAQPDLVLLACQRRIDHASARRDWAEVAALQPLAATWAAIRHHRDLDRELAAQRANCAVRVRRVEEVHVHGAREALTEAAARATALQAQLGRAMVACEASAAAAERAEGLRAACLETLEQLDASLRPTLEAVALRDPEATPAVDDALAALDHARARHRAVGRPLAAPVALAERLTAIAAEVAAALGARVTVVVRSGTPHRVRVHEAALRSAVRALLQESVGGGDARRVVHLRACWATDGLRLTFHDDAGPLTARDREDPRPDHPALRVADAERAWLGGTLTSRASGQAGPRHVLTLPVPALDKAARPTTLVEDLPSPTLARGAR